MRIILNTTVVLFLIAGAAQAQKVWAFDTAGNNEGWTQGSGITSFSTSGGSLNTVCTAADPNIYSPDFNASPIAGGSFPWIKIDLESTMTGDFQLFFIRTDRGISEADSFFFRVTAGRQLYQIHVPRRLAEVGKDGSDLWGTRNIRQFRFDYSDAGTVKVHSFAVESMPHPYWDFNIVPGVAAGHASGWYVANQLSNFTVTAAGTLNMNISGTDPFFSVDPLAFDPNSFRYMLVRQNHTAFPSAEPATAQTFAFPGTGGTGFVNKDWRHYPNNGWSTILLDMGTRTANSSWLGASGSISTLRVDPYQSTDTNGALYSYDIIGLRTATDLGSAAVQWNAMSGSGAWVAAKHSPYAGSAVALAGGVATITQSTGGQPMAMLNQDFVVNAANRYLYMDVEANTTAARNNLELRVKWAADGEDLAANERQRSYTTLRTKQGVNRYVFDLGTAQASPYSGAWGGYPHGLLLQFGAGDADLSWVKVSNIGLLSAAPPQINFVETETGTNASSYSKAMTLAAGSGVTWSLISPPAGMTINSGTGAISWPSPVYSATPYTITVRATNASGTDDEVFPLTISDATAPTGLTINSPSHVADGISNDTTIDMTLSGAADTGSGLSGYSWVFSTSAVAAVDDTVDTAYTGGSQTVSSSALADGYWYFRAKVRDAAGNWSAVGTWGPTRIDSTPPVITLSGSSPVTVACGSTYTDAGATALDAVFGNLTTSIVRVNPVNTAIPNTYTVTYNVSDLLGNAATQVTRTVNVVDNTPPVVTITGGGALSGECGVPLVLPGATASDSCAGTVPAAVSDLDGLNAASPAAGVYSVVYSASDGNGNTGTATLTVTVGDTAAPAVTITGGNTLSGQCGAPVTLPAASASDVCDGTFAATASDLDGLNIAAPAAGVYDVVYSATDAKGNTGTATLTVTIEDTAAPTVTISGGNALSGECGVSVTLPAASASDLCDGTFAATATNLDGLNVAAPAKGVYDVVYSATDAKGNTGTATLTVTIEDTAAPTVTISGGNALSGECGVSVTLPTASASDVCDGTFAATATDLDGLDVSAPAAGVYDVVYSATDAEGNSGTATLTVTVDDSTGPVITIPGSNPAFVIRGTVYTAPAASVFDACDGDLGTVAGTGTVDVNTLGAYTVTYAAQDAALNPSQQLLTVNVTEDMPPVITLTGDASVTVDCGAVYTDAGATAQDDLDGDVTTGIVVSGLPPAVPLAAGATYTVTYNVSDSGGKPAAQVTRTVSVSDNCTLNASPVGETDVRVEPGNRLELAVTASGAVGAPSYQWYFEAAAGAKAFDPVSGATDAVLTIASVAETDAGGYFCEVTDDVATVHSPVFTVTVGSALPVAGVAGLGLLAAATALAGAAAQRRRNGC